MMIYLADATLCEITQFKQSGRKTSFSICMLITLKDANEKKEKKMSLYDLNLLCIVYIMRLFYATHHQLDCDVITHFLLRGYYILSRI
jgi:hypothetical protein